ncbi:hypothetical protein ZIOFF_009962 [Zingiber officinale]|uniref:Uncharacterized protein n=1 Tax=Zingiber officinale TaxID=94328 RepID=A0A8J5HNU6_ZINOF|nr:hypothetical protein ZIOFF_009962 [Zingiber officinale]
MYRDVPLGVATVPGFEQAAHSSRLRWARHRVSLRSSKEPSLRALRINWSRQYSQDKQKREKKKWGFSKSNHDDNGSFIQMHRQQNIIERILEDVQNEQHQQHRVQQVLPKKAQQLKSPARKPRTVPNYAHISAIKIQAAYRGYRVRSICLSCII